MSLACLEQGLRHVQNWAKSWVYGWVNAAGKTAERCTQGQEQKSLTRSVTQFYVAFLDMAAGQK